MSVSVQSPASAASPSPSSSPSSTYFQDQAAVVAFSDASSSSHQASISRKVIRSPLVSPMNSSYLMPYSQAELSQSTTGLLDRIRSRSVFVSSCTSVASSSSAAAAAAAKSPSSPKNILAQQRKSLSASSFAQRRTAQLALLADQAQMAATGTSSLKIARANSLFIEQAVRQVAGEQSVAEQVETPAVGSSQEMVVDPAWEAAFSSPGFLASASSLASLFQAQVQSRKEWAGEALAIQHRRNTVDSNTSIGAHKRTSPSSDMQDPLNNFPKRRRLSADQQSVPSRPRRVSFAPYLIPPLFSRSTPPSTSTGSSPFRGSLPRSTPPPDLNELKSTLSPGSRRHSSVFSPTESRLQLLTNVIASFATLLDTRQQACASLAELAKRGEEMLPAASPMSGSRVSSPPPSAPPAASSSSFQGTADMCAIAESDDELDSEPMSATASSIGDEINEIAMAIIEEPAASAPAPAATAVVRQALVERRYTKEGSASPFHPEVITAASSGEASAMRLKQALADVKNNSNIGGCRTQATVPGDEQAPDGLDGRDGP